MWPDVRAALGALAELPVPEHDSAQAREAADQILSSSRYQWEEPSSNPLESLARWIADRLDDVLPEDLPAGGGTLPTWVGWAVLGIIVVVVLLVVWRARAGFRRNPRVDEAAEVVIDEGEEHRDWADEALAFEEAGRWRDGLRCRYRELVSTLAARDVIPDLVGRTAGEFVADVRRNRPAAARPFRAATDLFEAAWYGGRSGGPAERDAFVEWAAEVTAALDVLDAAPADRELVAPS